MKQVAVRQTAQYGAFGAKAKKRVCLFLANTLIALYSLWVDLGEKLEPVTAKLRVIGKKTKKRVCLFLANTLIALYSLWVDVQEGVCAAAAKLRVVGKKTKKRVCLLLANTLIALYSLWVDVQEGVCAAAAKLRVIGKKAKKGVCLFLANTLIRLYSLWVDTEEWVLSLRAKPKRRSLAQAAAMLVLAVGVLFGAFVTQGTEETVSWLSPVQAVIPGNEFTGKVISAYFHSGNGTKSSPYVITRPEHYYHMVQLIQRGVLKGNEYYQLGAELKGAGNGYWVYKYNDDGKQGDGRVQYLNMKGYSGNAQGAKLGTIVPIGGETNHTFTGHFNGNGIKITNMEVQTQDSYIFKGQPSQSVTYTNAGIFSTIGTSADVHDVCFENTTVIVKAAGSTVGVLAGRIEGTVSNITVGDSWIYNNSGKTLTSDYILAGSAGSKAVTEMNITNGTIGQPQASEGRFVVGSDSGAGGWSTSVDMEKIFERLQAVQNVAFQTTGDGISGEIDRYPTREYITIDQRNNTQWSTIYTSDLKKNTDAPGVSFNYSLGEDSRNSSFFKKDYTQNIESNSTYVKATTNSSTAGSYVFTKTGTATQTAANGHYFTTVEYAFLHGLDPMDGYKRTIVKNTITTTQVDYFYITDGKGNYLNLSDDNSAFVNGTSQSTATKWTMRSGYLYGMGQNGAYYLNLAAQGGGAYNIASPSLSRSTKWSYDSSSGSITFKPDSSKTYYIKYKDGVWYVAQDTGKAYYVGANVQGTKYYLNASGSTIQTTTEKKTVWYFENGTSGRFYYLDGDTKYYLDSSVNATDIGNSLSLKTDDGNSWSISTDGTGGSRVSRKHNSITVFLSIMYGSNRLNMAYVKNQWRPFQSDRRDLAMGYLEEAPDTAVKATAVSGGKTNLVTTTVEEKFDKYPGETYFPLSVVGDGNGGYSTAANLEASELNTGYIVSGGTKHGFYTNASGNIRFIRLDATKAFAAHSDTYSDGKLNDDRVATINADYESSKIGMTSVKANYPNYESAKENFEKILQSAGGKVCGLHFMGEGLDKGYVTASSVRISNKVYNNYQMPRNSLDFKVGTKGSICLFASTFYTALEGVNRVYNTAFFSLHQIFRDSSNNITGIKEISEIYLIGGKYIYKFTDSTTTDGVSVSGKTPVFKMSWLTNPTLADSDDTIEEFINRLYYFEIPVEAGEYALGSVSGEQGAYLLYLDVGSNAQVLTRKTIEENFRNDESIYRTLGGVTIGSSYQSSVTVANLTGKLSIAAGGNSTLSISGKTITASNATSANYIADGYKLSGISNATAISSSSVNIRRTTYYDTLVQGGENGADAYQLSTVEIKACSDNTRDVLIKAWKSNSNQFGKDTSICAITLKQGTDGKYKVENSSTAAFALPAVGSSVSFVLDGKTYTLTHYAVNTKTNNPEHYRLTYDGMQTVFIYPTALEVSTEINPVLYSFFFHKHESTETTITYTLGGENNNSYSVDIASSSNELTTDSIHTTDQTSGTGYTVSAPTVTISSN